MVATFPSIPLRLQKASISSQPRRLRTSNLFICPYWESWFISLIILVICSQCLEPGHVLWEGKWRGKWTRTHSSKGLVHSQRPAHTEGKNRTKTMANTAFILRDGHGGKIHIWIWKNVQETDRGELKSALGLTNMTSQVLHWQVLSCSAQTMLQGSQSTFLRQGTWLRSLCLIHYNEQLMTGHLK